MRSLVTDAELETMRARLAGATALPARPRLNAANLLASVALPFVLLADVRQALLISRLLTLPMLFVAGWALGRHAGIGAWVTGLGMTALGVALTAAAIALGG